MIELAHRPGHTRVTLTLTAGDENYPMEVHLSAPAGYRRLPWREAPAWDLVVCVPRPGQGRAELGCVEVPESAPEDVPHLFDVMTDSFLYGAVYLAELRRSVAVVESVGQERFERVYGLARLESPFGELECALLADADKGLETYQGREPAPNHGALCVDEHGLLVTPPEHLQGLALQSVKLGAPADVSEYPSPVQTYRG